MFATFFLGVYGSFAMSLWGYTDAIRSIPSLYRWGTEAANAHHDIIVH